MQKYLIHRSFIQAVLIKILDEISEKFNSKIDKFKALIGIQGVQDVKECLLDIKENIENNKILKDIELPAFSQVSSAIHNKNTINKTNSASVDINLAQQGFSLGCENSTADESEWEQNFSSIFLKVFQINDILIEIKKVLSILDIKHLYILLDDFSEIEDKALKILVDVLLAPLNNWSEEFIKFKIAAYPNRIYYGKIDPSKVDTINLDFYNLYSQFNRDKMESHAIDFTRRLLEKRVNKYVGCTPEEFFDVNNNFLMEDYYEVLFNVSNNVPRILGYILSYCYQSKISYQKKIGKRDIELAAEMFFANTTHSLMSIDDKISIIQLKNLLNKFIDKSKEIKKQIQSEELKGEI